MKDKIFGVLQRVGRSFMLPIALLPVAGLLLGLGSSLTNTTMLETYNLMGVMGPGTVLNMIFTVMSEAGNIVFANLPILSAVGRVFASPVGLILILAFFLFLITFLYIPDIISVLKEGKEEKTEEDKETIIQRRIEEEIKKLEEERKGGEKK